MLTKKQFDILTYFEKNKEQKTQRELAEVLQLSVGTINKTLKELNNFGYIVDNKISETDFEEVVSKEISEQYYSLYENLIDFAQYYRKNEKNNC